MTSEQTRQTMNAYAKALLAFGDISPYLADDVRMVFMGTDRRIAGKEAVQQTIKFFHEIAFSSAINVKSLLCGDGEAILEAEFIGTHIGEFEGVKPALKPVNVPYSVGYALSNNRIDELRLYFPFELLMKQIGATEGAGVA